MLNTWLALAALALALALGAAQARDQIRVVGSSTVFPLSTAVAAQFGRSTSFKTPVVESTGSVGGLKLFCAGVGLEHPDIANASRRITSSEAAQCAANGVSEVTEVKIGFDGLVIANARRAPAVSLTLRQLWLALAKNVPGGGDDRGELVPNPYDMWSDIDPSLPAVRIEVLGPPPTSGTRDAFLELAMDVGCSTFEFAQALEKSDEGAYKTACQSLREDGAWIDAGEDDDLILQKLEADPKAFGILGFSVLARHRDTIKGSTINGAAPTFETILTQDYPLSRPLYFYVKDAHVKSIPGMLDYVAEFTSEKAWGPDGYLAAKGLIPLPNTERKKSREWAMTLTPMTM